jgi:prepilin-type N-terminal cleavage/methylation domain-containing protein
MKKIKGFTLIELLIVIALLGALAVGLLAALDPFEQLKKGTDTGVRNTVSELQGAIVRYFGIKSEMPWIEGGSSDVSGVLTDGSNTSWVSNIIASGELKSDFFKLAENQLKYIYISGTWETATVCFQPLSKSFRSDPNTKFNQDGTDASGCPDPTSSACYWCVK